MALASRTWCSGVGLENLGFGNQVLDNNPEAFPFSFCTVLYFLILDGTVLLLLLLLGDYGVASGIGTLQLLTTLYHKHARHRIRKIKYELEELVHFHYQKIRKLATNKFESIKIISDSLYLKQETKSITVDVHTLRIDDNTDWPRNLQAEIKNYNQKHHMNRRLSKIYNL